MPVVRLVTGTLRRILVVDDEDNLRHMLQVFLSRESYDVVSVPGIESALAELETREYDCILCDVRMPKGSGLDLLDQLARRGRLPTVIMMSAYGSHDLALDAMKRGAYDYISKPFKPDEMLLTLRKAEERERLRRENILLKRQLAEQSSSQETPGALGGMIGKSAAIQQVFRTVQKVAEYKTNVLIHGESGTGKELVARALHDLSPRSHGPFVAVNCGAIPENLLESELFGHKKGAFTDASRDKKGLFEEAHGGTLFLDEIGEMPLGLQVKLLRAIQDEEIRRLGDNKEIPVDVRVVAATVRDLGVEVRAGRFREDLYYRLNVLSIQIPPLRDRREDIPLLVEYFVRRYGEKHADAGMHVESVAPETMEILLSYGWPGNVRELENTIERAMVLCEGPRIEPSVLEDRIRKAQDRILGVLTSGELSIKKTTRVIEEELIRRALQATGGNRTSAAKILEISHRALLYKIKEYGLGGE
ncbi:MAG: sigma-54-dependent Fis family transcriptional regulator [Deltaproteobacteria bacterium]|nr:sigma-54-dependent Fis family transcriptional regulator [Deltaproteobacteria bacterium]